MDSWHLGKILSKLLLTYSSWASKETNKLTENNTIVDENLVPVLTSWQKIKLFKLFILKLFERKLHKLFDIEVQSAKKLQILSYLYWPWSAIHFLKVFVASVHIELILCCAGPMHVRQRGRSNPCQQEIYVSRPLSITDYYHSIASFNQKPASAHFYQHPFFWSPLLPFQYQAIMSQTSICNTIPMRCQ